MVWEKVLGRGAGEKAQFGFPDCLRRKFYSPLEQLNINSPSFDAQGFVSLANEIRCNLDQFAGV